MAIKGHAIAGKSMSRDRVVHDYYATEPKSTKALLERERFDGMILEPCCGEGHISEVLKSQGYTVQSNDIVNRGYGETFKDFLNDDSFKQVDHIVTNPPFSLAKEFIERSLELTTGKVAMFCKIQLLEGISRREMFENTPLRTVYVFTKRQNPLRNGNSVDENGKRWSSTMCFAWFVWEHGYEGKPTIEWI